MAEKKNTPTKHDSVKFWIGIVMWCFYSYAEMFVKPVPGMLYAFSIFILGSDITKVGIKDVIEIFKSAKTLK